MQGFGPSKIRGVRSRFGSVRFRVWGLGLFGAYPEPETMNPETLYSNHSL